MARVAAGGQQAGAEPPGLSRAPSPVSASEQPGLQRCHSEVWAQSDLQTFKDWDDVEGDEEDKFRLHRANFLCNVCGLVYADGHFWSSRHSKKNMSNFAKGMQHTSMVFKFWSGMYHKMGHLTSANPLGLELLSADFNTDAEYTPPAPTCCACFAKKGVATTCTVQDGLLHADGTDTQALIGYREGRKTLVIAFRGTEGSSLSDVMTDLKYKPVPWYAPRDAGDTQDLLTPLTGSPMTPGGTLAAGAAFLARQQRRIGNVHRGMLEAFKSVEEALEAVLNKVLEHGENEVETILCTGHSLGGGLATMCALWIRERYFDCRVEVYTFGGAVVGDAGWKKYFDSKVRACYRLVNDQDIVPTFTGLGNFLHVGNEIFMNEIGLWQDTSKKKDDMEGGIDEHIDDHKVSNYLRLLHFYTMAAGDTHDMMANLEEAWNAYNQIATELQVRRLAEAPLKDSNAQAHGCFLCCGFRCTWGSVNSEVPSENKATMHESHWEISHEPVPNTKRMENKLRDLFKESEDVVELVQFEVARLCRFFKRKHFGFPVFALAVSRLLVVAGKEKEDNQDWAQCFRQFLAHDHDGDGFLSQDEFAELLKDVLVLGNNTEEHEQVMDTIRETFQQVDIDRDGEISFNEYFVWRQLLDESESNQNRLIHAGNLTFRELLPGRHLEVQDPERGPNRGATQGSVN